MNLGAPIVLHNSTVTSYMNQFALKRCLPKTSADVDKKRYDTTNLREILDRCSLFDNWVVHTGASSGWLEEFRDVCKMRNDYMGHNIEKRLRNRSRNHIYLTSVPN